MLVQIGLDTHFTPARRQHKVALVTKSGSITRQGHGSRPQPPWEQGGLLESMVATQQAANSGQPTHAARVITPEHGSQGVCTE
jgi:hypothetical protein